VRANRRGRVALVVSEVHPRPDLFPLFLALRFVLADAADADTAADTISAVDESLRLFGVYVLFVSCECFGSRV
jgi:hypothetical protein